MKKLMSHILAMVLVVSGCTDKSESQKKEQEKAAQENPPQPAPAQPAGLGPMAAMSMLGGLMSGDEAGNRWKEPSASAGAGRASSYFAVVRLSGALGELADPMGFSSKGDSPPLRKVIRRLLELEADPKVEGLLLRIDQFSASQTAAEELRAVLAASSKPVHCHLESGSNHTYMVLTACNSLAMVPAGGLFIGGPVLGPLYLKRMLGKLNIQPDFVHIGAYKGAAEPLTRTGPSKEMRKTFAALLAGSYQRLVQSIAQGRKLEEKAVRRLIDRALFTSEEAKQAGLVDEIATYEQWRDAKTKTKAWKRISVLEKKNPLDELFSMFSKKGSKRISAPHLALLYAVGQVVDGSGSGGPLGAFSEIAPRRLVPAIRAAAADDSVRAIVLRVDSPGGSATASELIWTEVVEANKKKPVIVSMGHLAASGGYYISCGASKILAQADTLTGSIGVVGGKMVLGKALQSLGLDATLLKKGKRADFFATLEKWSKADRALIKSHMTSVYRLFKQRVAQGRNMKLPQVERIAQGRVWIGETALAHGLIDQLGGLEQALALAREMSQLPADAPVEIYPGEPSLQDIIESFGGVSAPSRIEGIAKHMFAALDPASKRIATRMIRTVLTFAENPIQTIFIDSW